MGRGLGGGMGRGLGGGPLGLGGGRRAEKRARREDRRYEKALRKEDRMAERVARIEERRREREGFVPGFYGNPDAGKEKHKMHRKEESDGDIPSDRFRLVLCYWDGQREVF